MTRVLLFDWTSEGHHLTYLRQTAALISRSNELHVAAPSVMLSQLDVSSAGTVDLGAPRSRENPSGRRRPQSRALAVKELSLMRAAAERTHADVVLHLYSDPIIRELVKQPPMPAKIVCCMFFPALHYYQAFGSKLSIRETAHAVVKELLIHRFRGRPDAGGVLALDEFVVRKWKNQRGAPVTWLPEPFVDHSTHEATNGGRGVALIGSLAPRKGLERLVAATAVLPRGTLIVIAGSIQAGYETTFADHIRAIERSGCSVDVRAFAHTPAQLFAVARAARCVVLPYNRHMGMSRVLLECAVAQTPVIADRFGLVGHLTTEYDLGRTVDCEDPEAFACAIVQSISRADGPTPRRAKEFVDRYTKEALNLALRTAVNGAKP